MRALKYTLCSVVVALISTVAAAQNKWESGGDEPFLEYNNILPQTLHTPRPVQGLAISGRYGFSLRDRGMCVVLDIKKGEYVNSFYLEGNNSHCNNAGFGREKFSKESKFPLLYVSECTGSRCCYVTDITLEGSRVVQKIFYDSDEFKIAMDWVVDAQNGFIYVYGGRHFGKKYLKKLPLPKISDSDQNGEVHFTEKDVLQTIEIDGLAIAQGSKIHNGKAYLPDGCSKEGNKLHVIDLESGKKVGVYYYADQLNEPEGLDFKGKYLYTVFHPVTKPARHSVIYKTRF